MQHRFSLRTTFDNWKERFGKTNEQLAEHLGITVHALAALAAETVPANVEDRAPAPDVGSIRRAAEIHEADPDCLVSVFLFDPPDQSPGSV